MVMELEWLTNPVLSTPIRYAHGDWLPLIFDYISTIGIICVAIFILSMKIIETCKACKMQASRKSTWFHITQKRTIEHKMFCSSWVDPSKTKEEYPNDCIGWNCCYCWIWINLKLVPYFLLACWWGLEFDVLQDVFSISKCIRLTVNFYTSNLTCPMYL